MTVQYDVSWDDPNERLFDVAIRFTAGADDPRLILPSWRPGRYLLQNFAVNVRQWSANLTKVAPNVWQVAAKRGEQITVAYRYWAGTLDAGSCFLDEDEAYFNGSNLFMWVDGLRFEPVALSVRAPAAWQFETQLPATTTAVAGEGRDVTTFEARDYDHLADSPLIAAASFTRNQFEESGTTIRLILRGDQRVDSGQYVEPLRRIVREQEALFGELPLRDYRFLVHVANLWHGVEHEDSCSIVVKRADLHGAGPGSDGYDHFLSICSHEFFHLWNIKRMLPKVFAPYDYTKPTPTRLLWAMEGMTSYYGDLTIARAGLWSPERYLGRLAGQIAMLESTPANAHLSLSQASFDGWIQDPARPHDRGNAWFSFYTKGQVVAALLDLRLRLGGSSLDAVLRKLWSERTLDEDAVRRAAGPEHAEFFDRYVDGVEPLPYDELLAQAGIEYRVSSRGACLGAKVKAADGALGVESVTSGSTAMAAGLLPDDELIAIGATRTRTSSDVDIALRPFAEGERVTIVYARGGAVTSRDVTLRPDGTVTVELRLNEERNALREGWLAPLAAGDAQARL
jgi:predicted metalloprotease with PDZ domain